MPNFLHRRMHKFLLGGPIGKLFQALKSRLETCYVLSRHEVARTMQKFLHGCMREVRGQRSEVRCRRSEVRGRRSGSEVRGRRSEVGGRRSEVGGQRSEVRGQRSEVRGRRRVAKLYIDFRPQGLNL